MKFKVYKDRSRQWRWKLISRNGRIIADSAEAYRRKVDILKSCQSIIKNMHAATLEVEAPKKP